MKSFIKKMLTKYLFVIQEVDNEQRNKQGLKRLGRGYLKAYRFNPYNPLSYLAVVLIFILGIVMFGFVGFWKEIDSKNPFEWD